MNKIPLHVFIIFTLLIILSLGCKRSSNRVHKNSWDGLLTSDAEKIDKSWIKTNSEDIHLRGFFIPDNRVSLSGKTSIQLNKNNTQGFSFEIVGLKFLDRVTAKVWRYKKGQNSDLSISDKSSLYLYSMPTGKIKGDWEELEVVFDCYSNRPNDTLLIQCTFTGNPSDSAWFDDFSCEIKQLDNKSSTSIGTKYKFLEINLPGSSEKKLRKKRLKALRKGILVKKKDDLVKATINGDKKVKLRLKGDWTDHLIGDKWSMRIELKENKTWRNMSKFSIQSPVSRNMMNEWVFHKLLETENVLTTSYSYMPVKINKKDIGIMAIEEHFTQNFLINSNKLNGPILKFNEDYLWEARVNKLATPEGLIKEASEIKIFSRKDFDSSAELTETIEKGRWLLYAHQQNLIPLDSLFNIDLLAKYYALSELVGASHSYLWHNTRYYFNESNQLLEPIGFDANPTIRPDASDMEMVDFLNKTATKDKRILNLLASIKFRTSFIYHLNKYSQEEYLNQFLNSHNAEIKLMEELLQTEYTDYNFKKNQLYYRANTIQQKLTFMDNEHANMNLEKLKLIEPYSNEKLSVFHTGVSVLAYSLETKNDTNIIEIVNFHHEKITILNSINKDVIIIEPRKQLNTISKKKIRVFNDTKIIKFTYPSSKEVHSIEVSKYKFPKNH